MFYFKYYVNLNDFDIGDLVGKGNYAFVHRGIRKARHNHPEIECAIKLLFREVEIEEFMREVGCQASLKHPAILSLIGFSLPIVGEGRYAIITDIMPNGTLEKLVEEVRRGNAPENWEVIKACNIFGIAAGMAFVHQNHIMHRDLKIENVMLDAENLPKIADFGLSRFVREDTEKQIQLTRYRGTPTYMAPELFDCINYTNKVDVFSYSYILYELNTSKKAWSDRNDLNLFTLIGYIKNNIRPKIDEYEISDEFVQLIHRCWDGDPQVRPSFIEIVKEFMDNKEKYFRLDEGDMEVLKDYIELVTKDLDFSKLNGT